MIIAAGPTAEISRSSRAGWASAHDSIRCWRGSSKIGGGDATYIGDAGAKRFVDATVPAGTAQVTYQIQAIRSTAAGAWATFVVNIGVGSSDAMLAANESPVKLAA